MDPADWNGRLAALQAEQQRWGFFFFLDIYCHFDFSCGQSVFVCVCSTLSCRFKSLCRMYAFLRVLKRFVSVRGTGDQRYLVTLSDWRLTPDYGSLRRPEWQSQGQTRVFFASALTKHDRSLNNKKKQKREDNCGVLQLFLPVLAV